MILEHIALYVNDLEAARRFFTDYFGAQSNEGYFNPRTGLRTYFLTMEGGSRLEIMNKPVLPDTGDKAFRSGYAHIAFKLESRMAVDNLTARFAADGYEVLSGPRVTGDGYYESCIAGIEGNIIEITA
jgi:lactoylglutathione lyase